MYHRKGETMRRILIIMAIVILAFPIVNAALTDNILLYYGLNSEDLSGTPNIANNVTVQDLSTNNRDGYYGDANWTTAKLGTKAGNSTSKPSTESFIVVSENCPNSVGGGWCPDGNMTQSMWVKLNYVSSTETLYIYFGSDTSTTSNMYGIIFRLYSSDVMKMYYVVSNARYGWTTGTNNPSSCSWVDGNWHHLVMMRNDSNIELYCDGVWSSTVTAAHGSTDWVGNNNIVQEKIAYFPVKEANGWSIDDYAMWDRTLTAAEVGQLYNSGTGYNPYATTSTCTYSGSGDWIITEDCTISSDVNLALGATMMIKGSYTVKINSGVTIS